MESIFIIAFIVWIVYQLKTRRQNDDIESMNNEKFIDKKLRQHMKIGNKVMKQLNSRPSPGNRIGALTISDDSSLKGKLSLSDHKTRGGLSKKE